MVPQSDRDATSCSASPIGATSSARRAAQRRHALLLAPVGQLRAQRRHARQRIGSVVELALRLQHGAEAEPAVDKGGLELEHLPHEVRSRDMHACI